MLVYWHRVVLRAFRESWSLIVGHTRATGAGFVAVTIIAFILQSEFLGADVVTEGIYVLLTMLAAGTFVWFVVFVAKLVSVPAVIDAELRAQLDSKEATISELREEQNNTKAKERRRLELCNELATFMKEGRQLHALCINERGSPEVETAANQWHVKAHQYIERELGPVYTERLDNLLGINFIGCIPHGYPIDKSNLLGGILGRVARMEEFIKEIQQR